MRHNIKQRHFAIEQLESRRVLAALTVTSLDDSGAGSLREAIEFANTDTGGASGADEIVFESGLLGTIALESTLPTITDDLVITGPTTEQLILDAGGGIDPNIDGDGFRLFLIDDGINENLIDVAIQNLTLTGGDIPGDPLGRVSSGGAVLTAEISRLGTPRLAAIKLFFRAAVSARLVTRSMAASSRRCHWRLKTVLSTAISRAMLAAFLREPKR